MTETRRTGGPFRRPLTLVLAGALVASFAGGPAWGIVPRKPAGPKPTAASKPDASLPETTAPVSQVEVFVPSVARLAAEARRSHTGRVYEGLSGLLALKPDETGEGFDMVALTGLAERIASWPDTSLALVAFTQDSEGRPRWLLRVDWPLDDTRGRIESLLTDEDAAKILENIELRRSDAGDWRIELPDTLLAVLSEDDGGTRIASAPDLRRPDEIYGQPNRSKAELKNPPAGAAHTPALVYCRLNLTDTGEGSSMFGAISGIQDIRYSATVDRRRCWNERFSIRWSPFVGMMMKAAVRKVREPFECPREAFATAAFNIESAPIASALMQLESDPLAARLRGESAVSVMPGTGFLPMPDIYFQFIAKNSRKSIESLREAIEADTAKRREDDERPAWREESIDGRPVFWRDPGADAATGFSLVSYRTVVFFEPAPDDETQPGNGMIVAATSGWAEDAVRRWQELREQRGSRTRVPDSPDAHWQGRIAWRKIYEFVQPYLVLSGGADADEAPPPSAAELGAALRDSVVNVRIDFNGLGIRHVGPLPVGAAYVPAVVAGALRSSDDTGSEAAREQVACRKLRVLYHHAKLFKKDFGRWPATVAELDGYVDFASHPELLHLRPARRGLGNRVIGLVLGDDSRADDDSDAVQPEIDDGLYEIEWSPDDWKLKIRAGEFQNLATIYIDQDGEIHRIPKAGDDRPGPLAGR